MNKPEFFDLIRIYFMLNATQKKLEIVLKRKLISENVVGVGNK
jgi:hypothetical protein